MRKYAFITAVILFFLTQMGYPRYLTFWGAKPDLLLLCAVMSGLLFEQGFAVGVSIFIGLLQDSLSAGGFPSNTILFPLWSWVMVWVSRRVSLSDVLIRTAAVAIIAFAHNLLNGFIHVYGGKEISAGVFLRIMITQIFYTTVISVVICYFIEDVLPRERQQTDLETHSW